MDNQKKDRTLEVLFGLSCSGKSTYALNKLTENPTWQRTNKDEIRENYPCGIKEKKVIEIENALVHKYLDEGFNVIMDNTHLNRKIHIPRIQSQFGHKANIVFNESFLDVPLETILERAKLRNDGKDWVKIVREQQKFLRPVQIYEDPSYYNSNLPLAVIFDLDNTLTFNCGRSPYAEDCSGDSPNIPVVEICKMYCDRPDVTVICLSGRKESARLSTENWLLANGINYDYLYMRQQDDNRRDSIMKRQVYEEKIKGKYLIHLVCDDRFQVCDELWRVEGLPLLQFGNSNF